MNCLHSRQFTSNAKLYFLWKIVNFVCYTYAWCFQQGGHALWKTGKMVEKKTPCREKSGNLKFCWKSGKNQGIPKNLIFVRSKYSNFIAVQMWLLVVSFCYMLKIPADLILLKGGVLVRWSTCLLYILFFLFLIPKWTFIANPMSVIKFWCKNIHQCS